MKEEKRFQFFGVKDENYRIIQSDFRINIGGRCKKQDLKKIRNNVAI